MVREPMMEVVSLSSAHTHTHRHTHAHARTHPSEDNKRHHYLCSSRLLPVSYLAPEDC